jgi:hypothetical protein
MKHKWNEFMRCIKCGITKELAYRERPDLDRCGAVSAMIADGGETFIHDPDRPINTRVTNE